jgi:plasmid segregation protein ParM
LQIAINDKGQVTGNAGTDESWGVVEIGHFTTDFCLQIDGLEIQKTSESTRGIADIYNAVAADLKRAGFFAGNVKSIELAIQHCETKKNGVRMNVKHLVEPIIDKFASDLCNTIAARFGPQLANLDGLIITGGGALLVGAQVKARYPIASTPANPRFSVSDGLARFAMATIH